MAAVAPTTSSVSTTAATTIHATGELARRAGVYAGGGGCRAPSENGRVSAYGCAPTPEECA
jgi:hypothetical protein